MQSKYEAVEEKEEAYLYRGIEGFKNYLQDILKVGETVYFIGAKNLQKVIENSFSLCGIFVKTYELKCDYTNLLLSEKSHSYSIVAGGFCEISYTTLLTPFTSLIILLETFSRMS